MSAIASGLQWFVNLGASVMLPILLFIFALILRIKPSKAFKAGLMVGIGFYWLEPGHQSVNQESWPCLACHG
jgi:PTS system galactitol-specific IIC component